MPLERRHAAHDPLALERRRPPLDGLVEPAALVKEPPQLPQDRPRELGRTVDVLVHARIFHVQEGTLTRRKVPLCASE